MVDPLGSQPPDSYCCHCNLHLSCLFFINVSLLGISLNIPGGFTAPCLLPGMLFCIEHLTRFFSSLKTYSHITTPMGAPPSPSRINHLLIGCALHLMHTCITAQIALYYNYVCTCLSSLLDSEFLAGQGWDLFVFPSLMVGRLSLTHRPLINVC